MTFMALTVIIIVCAVVGGLAALWRTVLEEKVNLFKGSETDKILKSAEYKAWERSLMKKKRSSRPIKIRKIK